MWLIKKGVSKQESKKKCYSKDKIQHTKLYPFRWLLLFIGFNFGRNYTWVSFPIKIFLSIFS